MKGTYLLVIDVKKDLILQVGSLGKISFKKGRYCYIGSAMGPGQNALENRVKRHLKNSESKKFHWHIDYLLVNKNVFVEKVFAKQSEEKLECSIASKISNLYGLKEIDRFGSSDCSCLSHLFKIKNMAFIERLGFKEFKF